VELLERLGEQVLPPGSSAREDQAAFEQQAYATIMDSIDDQIEVFTAFDFTCSVALLRRMKHEVTPQNAIALSHELSGRVEDEFTAMALMRLLPDKAKHWEQRAPFGEAVFERLPEARMDITEAGNCYAAGRNTACVFHLMRTMEHALRALATSLSIPDPGATKDRSWGIMLNAIQDGINAVAATRKGWKQGNGAIFQGAHGLLIGVRDAWRNPCMHLEAKYDENDALRIYNAVNGFMAHLATIPEKA